VTGDATLRTIRLRLNHRSLLITGVVAVLAARC